METKQRTYDGRDLTGAQMAQMLDEFVNGCDEKHMLDFCDQLVNRTHRTLQQKIATLMMRSFTAWANLAHDRYDLRNEATVKLARTIVNSTKEVFYKSLPLI